MSIIIEDMIMPKSCVVCPFEHNGDCYGGKPKLIKDIEDFNYYRHPNCPLKEVVRCKDEVENGEITITWVQRRGQIKHLLYELCLTGRIDKATLVEQFNDLNSVTPVVRCKDCKHLMTYNDGTYDCKYLAERMFAEGELNNKPDDFCCWAERKESDNADSDTDTDDI